MSLFGLDEMYNELLLEAKSPEEIKKILEYQFVQGKGVPQEILDKVFAIDPTKKKTYTKWVLMQWDNEKDNIMQSLKDGHLQDMFKYFQERANTGLNLLGMKSFEEAMRELFLVQKRTQFLPLSLKMRRMTLKMTLTLFMILLNGESQCLIPIRLT